LLGPWDELELDPTTWAVGTDTLCGYTAKVGRQRAGLHAACKADPPRAELGWRPKLWPRPQQGQQGEAGPAGGPAGHLTQLAEAEGRWVQSCLDREAAPPGSRPRLSEAARAARFMFFMIDSFCSAEPSAGPVHALCPGDCARPTTLRRTACQAPRSALRADGRRPAGLPTRSTTTAAGR
jgi:hypothetical protein